MSENSALTLERWRMIDPIIDAALDLPSAQRSAYVRARCNCDPALLAIVERLLARHDEPSAELDLPAAQRFSSLLEDGPLNLPEILGGRYRVGRVLGRGGMATVFLADDLRHERQVAIKVLHAELAAALGSALFLAEIKTTARLQHSHILPLHDSGDDEGMLYYVMPYVPGGTLRQHLQKQGSLPIDEALRITEEVASALDAAPRHGVVHRDIKPENILLHDGTALVADFGIALALSAAGGGRLAKPGVRLGTRQYMSPEQRDGTVDGRSDVYSLGVVVWEMLAGRAPFATPPEPTSTMAVQRAPSLRELRPEIPAGVDAAVSRALAPSPADRYASAGELADAMRQAVASNATQPTGPRWSRRASRAAATLVGAPLLVGLIALFGRPTEKRFAHTANQQAVDLYIDGTSWLDRRTPEGAAHAESCFKRAIAIDSTYSLAYSGLADVYSFYGIDNVGDYAPKDYFPKARKLAQRAVDLDSSSAEAHAAKAEVLLFYDLDWSSAEREFESSLSLNSQYVIGRGFHVSLLEFTRHFDEAISEARETAVLQPLSTWAATEVGRALIFGKQFEAARDKLSSVIARDSTQYRAHLLLGEVFAQQHMYDSAVLQMQAAVRYAPKSSRAHAYLAFAYARAGRRADAERELKALNEKSVKSYVPALNFAVVYAGLEEMDKTFEWLGKAVEDHSMRVYLQDATFDAIRADPRYALLMARMHLPYQAVSKDHTAAHG